METNNNKLYEKIFSALVIPFFEDESINYKMLRQLVENQIKSGVEGFYVCGSSGEGLLLSLDERKKITECVIEQADGRVPVIAHCGTIRTADVIELVEHAKSAGCCAVSMIPPYYYRFSADEIIDYYEDVIHAVSDIPIILYNIPQFTGVEFNKDNAGKLLENFRIIGIKHTSQNLYSLERMASSYPDKIMINGFDEQFLGALSMGARATIGTTVNLFAPLFKGIRAAYYAGNMRIALELQKDLNQRVEGLVSVGIFPATKYGCSLLGTDCGECRKPFMKISDEQKTRVREIVQKPYPDVLSEII